MDPLTIIALVNGVAQLSKVLAPQVAKGMGVWKSEDEVAVKAALAELQAANEALFARVQDKLRG